MTWFYKVKESLEAEFKGLNVEYMGFDNQLKLYQLSMDDYDLYMSNRYQSTLDKTLKKLDTPRFFICYMHSKWNLENQC